MVYIQISEFIKKYKNHPILFVGTGFSLRYLENSYTWEGLLKHISKELTGNDEFYWDIKSRYDRGDGNFSYEKIATELEEKFNNVLELERDGKFKRVNDAFYESMREGKTKSRFKIYISELLKEISYKETMYDEITELKKIRKNIGSIITTNYDKLIENIFDFTPLVGNNILLSNPYGSVYKIHGCVDEEDKIIISENDYKNFDEKYELIRAQLLSLFIHNPIIFIGYSINDENIRKLLKTIFTYVPFNSPIADKIKSNFLLVEYEKDKNSVEVRDHDAVIEGLTTVRINSIKTDNFTEIYSALAALKLPVSAMDIRKVQSVVKEIYEGGDIKVSIVDDLDALKNGEKVVAIGNVNKISYSYHTQGELINNYFKIIEEDNAQLISVIDKFTIQSQQFYPVFGFTKINTELSKAEKLKKQQVSRLRSIISSLGTKQQTDHQHIQDILNDECVSSTNKHNAIIYSILNSKISLDEVKQYLLNLEEHEKTTKYRKILCAYDYMNYKTTEENLVTRNSNI